MLGLPSACAVSAPDEAVEHVRGAARSAVFLTCEHASQRLPGAWRWPARDERLLDTHWAYDLGARDLTIELARALDAAAVLARFTRLLVDPNREEGHADLCRAHAEGEPVLLNEGLEASERERRLHGYHRPYHAAVDAALGAVSAPILLSIHSFTPSYQGEAREMELGVLFNRDERAAYALGEALAARLPRVAYNEPWSGRAGLIYAAERHAERHGRIALELEVRQDRAVDPAYRAELAAVLKSFFASYRGP